MITSLATIFCWVSDMERSAAFYRDVLGFECHGVWGDWASLSLGGAQLGLHRADSAQPRDGWVLGVRTDDLDALEVRLRAHGVDCDAERHEVPGGITLAFRDPDGNALQAYQPR